MEKGRTETPASEGAELESQWALAMSPLSTLNASRFVVPGPLADLPTPVAPGEQVSIRIQGRPVRGVVKYCGSIQGKPRGWVGVDLDDPVGWTDGTFDGHRYFTCEPAYGVFVQPHQVIRRGAAPAKHSRKTRSAGRSSSLIHPDSSEAEAAEAAEERSPSKESHENTELKSKRQITMLYPMDLKIAHLRHETTELRNYTVPTEVTRLVKLSTTRWAKNKSKYVDLGDSEAATTRWDLIPMHLIGQAEHARSKLRKSIAFEVGEGPRARMKRQEAEEEEGDDVYDRIDPRDQDFSSLRREDGKVVWIPEVENRAITVTQLCALQTFIKSRTNEKGRLVGWYDSSNKDHPYLYAKSVNLYQVASWIIRPMTEDHKSSYIEAVTTDAEKQKPSWFISHWWGECVLHFVDCVVNHQNVRTLSYNVAYWVCAYANNQHELGKDLGRDPMQSSFLRAMEASTGVLLILDKDCTAFTRIWCCFEEGVVALAARGMLKTAGSQGERTTLNKLASRDGKHGRQRALKLDISTYCARDEEQLCLCDRTIFLTGHGHSMIAKGAILMCHSCLTPLTQEEHRAFYGCHICEVYFCMKCNKKSKAELLTDGLTELEKAEDEEQKGRGWRMKVNREASFPITTIKRGLRINILTANSSQSIDKIRILNALSNQDELDAKPPIDSPNFHIVNSTLQATFALAAWNQALVKNLDISDHGRLPLQRAIREDTTRTMLAVNLRSTFRSQDDFEKMASTLSYLTKLNHLALDLSMCPNFLSIASLGSVLGTMKKLQDLTLDMHCTAITTGILELSESVKELNETLTEFDLELRDCQGLPQPLQRHFSSAMDFVKKATWKARLERQQKVAQAVHEDTEAEKQAEKPSSAKTKSFSRLGSSGNSKRFDTKDSTDNMGMAAESRASTAPSSGSSTNLGGSSSTNHGERTYDKQKCSKSNGERHTPVPSACSADASNRPLQQPSLRSRGRIARVSTGISKVVAEMAEILPQEHSQTPREKGGRVSIIDIGTLIAGAQPPSSSRNSRRPIPEGFVLSSFEQTMEDMSAVLGRPRATRTR
eukprot:TRINITY_DN102171_c0_g1_i1.p1 TRINITY_DN102171_c0_g1~~TRINITY_DN102171_c0_g1_i1.p1  ORF type:complete len:1056 (-),score=146.04 TRINITY_DN102171_c0_g1_i1:67-3234(-)